MSDTNKNAAAVSSAQAAMSTPDTAALNGLFTEMQALMALMPGTAFDTGARVATEEEVEEMFDNMPV